MAVWEKLSIRNTLKELSNVKSGFHWLVIRSASLDGYCDCVNEIERNYETANPSCWRCLGSGRIFTDFLVKGIQYIQTRQFAADEAQAPPGIINNQQFRYAILTDNIIPKTHDLLLEIELDKDTGEPLTPIRIRDVFNVANVRTMWGDKGREEFYSIVCEYRTILPGTFRRTKSDY